MGISFEEKAFYDILVKVRDDHHFEYADDKCVVLAKEIKKLVDDKAQYADWASRDDIKNQLNMDLTILLYQNGYRRNGMKKCLKRSWSRLRTLSGTATNIRKRKVMWHRYRHSNVRRMRREINGLANCNS